MKCGQSVDKLWKNNVEKYGQGVNRGGQGVDRGEQGVDRGGGVDKGWT